MKFIWSSAQKIQASKQELRILTYAIAQLLQTLDEEYNAGRIILGKISKQLDDGQRIVSSSSQKGIRICDSRTGRHITGPFSEQHGDSVWCVALSPDGTRIASGCADHTVGMWATEAEKKIVTPLKAHDDSVISVAFTPDGKRIASVGGKSVNIWNKNGEPLYGPLNKHAVDVVNCVAFFT